MLQIDTRETKLIALIKSLATDFTIPYKVVNLHIGDIVVEHGEYSIIIERKCLTDMVASIKDGRYKEQKLRLFAESSRNPNNIIFCYILEGIISDIYNAQDRKIFEGAIVSSILRDKIPLIHTYTLQETLDIIIRICERMKKIPNDLFTTPPLQGAAGAAANADIYLQAVKKCKKDNITPATWHKICYMNIPGISHNIASKIAEKYPTIKSLLTAYDACTTTSEKENLLANIQVGTSTNTPRKLGPTISKRIHEYVNM